MVTCKRCGGNCDNGEVVGGICLECMEEERQEQIRADSILRMRNSPAFQMWLDLGKTELDGR